MKKVLAILLALCLVFIQIPQPIHAAVIVNSGECGEHDDELTWQLTEDGTLTISGTGKMRNYILSYRNPPWPKITVKKIIVEEGVTRIGDYAFFDLSYVTSVSLPQSLTSIGNGAFKRCMGITEIDLPCNLTELGFDAFNQCTGLQRITIPDGVTEINGGCFEMCTELTEVILPDHIQFFGPKAFYCAALRHIDIPDTVTHIGEYAFQNCNFSEVIIPDSVISIERFAFFECGALKSITIPNGVTKIEDGTFGSCLSLKTIVLPENLESMGDKVFNYCSSLENIVFPEKRFSIGSDLFCGCTSLFELSFPGDVPSFSENTFQYYTGIIRYPSNDDRWTPAVQQNYGGTITWVEDTHIHDLETTITPPTCNYGGYTTDVCLGCGAVITRDRVNALDHDLSAATCTEPQTCQREGCAYTQGGPLGHEWDDPAAMPRTCTRCSFYDNHVHNYNTRVQEPGCISGGFTTYYCTLCNYAYTDDYVDALGHDMVEATCEHPRMCLRCGSLESKPLEHIWEDPCLTTRTCSVCGYSDNEGGHFWDHEYDDIRGCRVCGIVEGGYHLNLEPNLDDIWIDGEKYTWYLFGNHKYTYLKHNTATTLVTYTYNKSNPEDIHAQYPTGMKVWRLSCEGSYYTATLVAELENILQYAGSSIRIGGVKGIRMITAMDKSKKEALTGQGLAGYKLVEYGTALCWAKDLKGGKPMVLGQDYVKSNYAYKKGVADPVFAQTKDTIQYTNVLVGFTLDQCEDDIAMRPYIILEDANGQRITIYGGIVYRSISYIAYQNRNVFKPGSSSYIYVWDIIHYVYGDKYDADYKP